jgi:tungstate transport system substrate-binding protein
LFVLVLVLASCLSGCVMGFGSTIEPKVEDELILATTTSTRDSGLLDVLLPVFEQQSGYRVKVVAVGTGQALKMGQEGNADVLLVHAPAAELDFMAAGYGATRQLVMHNDFVLLGPADDPAGVCDSATAVDAFKMMADGRALFVSRGDDSGTHKAELALWSKAGVEVSKGSDWYLETGQGMGETLRVASEKQAYTLTDRATYLAQKETLNLKILVQGDNALLNIYHVITINPQKWPAVNSAGAEEFVRFMLSDETQKQIAEFGIQQFGQPLFFADVGKDETQLGQ